MTEVSKATGLSRVDIADASKVVYSGRPADVNRRRRIPLICEGYDLLLEIRISLDDPRDVSVSLLLRTEVDGNTVRRIIARYDCVGIHSMGWLGSPDLVGPHLHLLTERYQKAGKNDDAWAVPMEGDTLEDALSTILKRFHIDDDESEMEEHRCHPERAYLGR